MIRILDHFKNMSAVPCEGVNMGNRALFSG